MRDGGERAERGGEGEGEMGKVCGDAKASHKVQRSTCVPPKG